MSKSFQHEKPPARVNLFLEVAKGDAKEKVELPMRLLVMGDFTGREDSTPLEQREIINLTPNNFEDVMKSHEVRTKLNVENTLTGDGDLAVDLKFDSMRSFDPDKVAMQVPELARLMAARNLLQDLRNRIISVGQFRRELESVIKDEKSRSKLLAELDKVVESEEDTPASGN